MKSMPTWPPTSTTLIKPRLKKSEMRAKKSNGREERRRTLVIGTEARPTTTNNAVMTIDKEVKTIISSSGATESREVPSKEIDAITIEIITTGIIITRIRKVSLPSTITLSLKSMAQMTSQTGLPPSSPLIDT